MTEIFMPKAGMDMKEGRLIRWLKEIGDSVEKDEPIMEIETDKITMEAEAPGSGIFLKKLIDEDTVVPVLAVIGYIGKEGEPIPEAPQNTVSHQEYISKKEPTPEAAENNSSFEKAMPATPYAKMTAREQGISLQKVTPSPDGVIRYADVLATPLARRVAEDQKIDLSTVQGSGYHGKITRGDVERSRKADYMPAAINVKTDVTELLALLSKLNGSRSDSFSMLHFLIKAVAAVLEPNASVGVALYTENGRMVPVILEAGNLTLSAVAGQVDAFAEKEKQGLLVDADCAGAQFGVCSLENFSISSFTPVPEPTQWGMFGIGGVQEELTLTDGVVTTRKKAVLSLSYDGRKLNEAQAAALVTKGKALLESPMEILV